MTNEITQNRKFIGINFTCCRVYARIYFNARLNAYIGRCPKCLREARVMVDKEKATTNSRFFKAE